MTGFDYVATFKGIALGGASADRALNILFRAEGRRVLAFACREGLSKEDAEDVLQTTLLNLTRAGKALGATENPEGYFWRMVRNALTDVLRTRANAGVAVSIDDEDSAVANVIKDSRQDLGDHTAYFRCFERAWHQFRIDWPDKARAIRETVLSNMSGAELAEKLGYTHGALRTLLWKASGDFRALLTNRCGDPADMLG